MRQCHDVPREEKNSPRTTARLPRMIPGSCSRTPSSTGPGCLPRCRHTSVTVGRTCHHCRDVHAPDSRRRTLRACRRGALLRTASVHDCRPRRRPSLHLSGGSVPAHPSRHLRVRDHDRPSDWRRIALDGETAPTRFPRIAVRTLRSGIPTSGGSAGTSESIRPRSGASSSSVFWGFAADRERNGKPPRWRGCHRGAFVPSREPTLRADRARRRSTISSASPSGPSGSSLDRSD